MTWNGWTITSGYGAFKRYGWLGGIDNIPNCAELENLLSRTKRCAFTVTLSVGDPANLVARDATCAPDGCARVIAGTNELVP